MPDSPFANNDIAGLARLIRRHCLVMTSHAGSGHPTSSLSAADLMAGLLFGGVFRHDAGRPDHPNNDRLVFSKGHASPLFYALWAAAGCVSADELMTYRRLGSRLQGHPTPQFPHAEAATGSLGQGLGIGVGLALNARLDRLPCRTYVLLGDSEMAEGSQWEAIQLAAHHRLDNLVGILDVNRLGQRGETMLGHDIEAHARRVGVFGWKTICIDGHDLDQIVDAYRQAAEPGDRPVMIVARTIKGKGVSFLEDAEDWHGKALDDDRLQAALDEIGPEDPGLTGRIPSPEDLRPAAREPQPFEPPTYTRGDKVATRKAYGAALKRIHPGFPRLVVLDGEVSNSTGAETFKEDSPDDFLEMFIAEQNMVSVALGLSLRGKLPFVSTFSAFFSRAFDQIRMSQYSDANLKFVGSHAGVSIGEDGPSQMGLEDIAMFRSLVHSVVLHPCDAVSTERLVETAAGHTGIVYLRTLRESTPVIYENHETFPVGGSKVLRRSDDDLITIVAAGVTVHEALAACETLRETRIHVRVIDAYSIKPIDTATLLAAAVQTHGIITVEDHYPAGGLGEAVLSALAPTSPVPVKVLAVHHLPMSGPGDRLRDHFGISARAIVQEVRALIDYIQTPDSTIP